MSVIKKMRKQTAIWWERTAADRYGQYGFRAPVEIKCRWDGVGSEFRSKAGAVEISDATVYPDRPMKVGDKLKLGSLDSNTPDNPTNLIDAFEIKKFGTTPNFKATEFLYTAYL
jgi:hypothetical protein